MKRSVVLLVSVMIMVALFIGLTGGLVLGRAVQVDAAPPTTPATGGPNVQLIEQAWKTLQQNYVDRPALQSTSLTYGAISGMVDALGDTGHSRFLSPDMVRQENDFTKGQFEGIGAEVQSKDGNMVIVAPIDGSPAQKAGLKPGDIIAKVDGKDVSGLPLNQAVALVLGPAGTKVTLTIVDPNTGATRDVTLTRASIAIHSVTWQQLPGTSIAHLRIAEFTPDVTKGIEGALGEMKQKGITGVVLDLRSDPGGLLDQAIGAASEFLTKGNVLEQKDAQGKITTVPVKPGGVAPSIPLVVLTDQGTASAAEIVAAALQDAGRAQVIGQTTFGTGTVLQSFGLADGSALLIATSEWLSPSGKILWRHGVTPNVTVALPSGNQPLIPESERNLTAAQLQSSKDAQLLKALDTLQGAGKAAAPASVQN